MREKINEEPLNTRTLHKALQAYADRPYEIRVRMWDENTNKYQWYDVIRLDNDEGRLYLQVGEE